MNPEREIFKDLKVVELAGVLAGPSAGLFFAELGARVIKVENPKTGGDITRSWKLKSEDTGNEGSAYFWSVNGFKEFRSVDLSTAAGQATAHTILKEADIVITNYKSGDAEKLKMDYSTISALNPGIIYAAVSGFGTSSERIAYDLILQAESGFMSMNGEAGSKATKMPVALIDLLAGHQLKEAILIALLRRHKSGKGSHVTVSLFDSAIASLANQATNWLIANHLPVPSGSLHPNIAPYGELFDTKDNQLVTLAIGSNKQFKTLCAIIEYPALALMPKYASNQSRVTHRQELYPLLYDYIRKIPFALLYERCIREGVPIGKIRNLREVFSLPEAKEMLRKVSAGRQNLTIVSSLAFRFES